MMRKDEYRYIRTGDIVLVKDYPNPQFKEARSRPTKDRFAIVIGNFREGFISLSAQAIATKRGQTERAGYRLKENELRIPEGIVDDRRDFEITGVIKAHRFPLIKQNQMAYKAGSLPLETKLHLVQLHERMKNLPHQVAEMKQENPNFLKVMGYFKEVTLAEKLQFMRDNRGNYQYEFLRNKEFSVKSAQFLEKRKNLNVISVQLEGSGKKFYHTFATRKSLNELQQDWKSPKKAKEWIREDVKFHTLQRNPLLQLKPDKQPHPDKYKLLEKLQETKPKEPELER